MLIAEELFLLLRRDDGKPESAFTHAGYGLAAAVITDLILAERVSVSEEKDPKISVVSAEPTGDSVLDPALLRLREREGKKLSSLVTDGKLNPEKNLAQSLADKGILTIEEKRAWGFVPARYPVVNPEPERVLRTRLRTVIAGGTPTTQDGPLLAILQGLDTAPKVLQDEMGMLTKKQLKERIKVVSEEGVAGQAVAAAVRAINAAMIAAVVLPIVASGGAVG